MLAGGLPSPAYFPFESLSAEVLQPSTYRTTTKDKSGWWSSLFSGTETLTSKITIPKYATGPVDPNKTIQVCLSRTRLLLTGLLLTADTNSAIDRFTIYAGYRPTCSPNLHSILHFASFQACNRRLGNHDAYGIYCSMGSDMYYVV
jgi:hypothetical protein